MVAEDAESLVSLEFMWRHGGSKVVLTGNFDNWQGSICMHENPRSGYFETKLHDLNINQKLLFKFIVDGIWRCSLEFPTEVDSAGNVNNVIHPELTKALLENSLISNLSSTSHVPPLSACGSPLSLTGTSEYSLTDSLSSPLLLSFDDDTHLPFINAISHPPSPFGCEVACGQLHSRSSTAAITSTIGNFTTSMRNLFGFRGPSLKIDPVADQGFYSEDETAI